MTLPVATYLENIDVETLTKGQVTKIRTIVDTLRTASDELNSAAEDFWADLGEWEETTDKDEREDIASRFEEYIGSIVDNLAQIETAVQ